jgi:hypothetical protein
MPYTVGLGAVDQPLRERQSHDLATYYAIAQNCRQGRGVYDYPLGHAIVMERYVFGRVRRPEFQSELLLVAVQKEQHMGGWIVRGRYYRNRGSHGHGSFCGSNKWKAAARRSLWGLFTWCLQLALAGEESAGILNRYLGQLAIYVQAPVMLTSGVRTPRHIGAHVREGSRWTGEFSGTQVQGTMAIRKIPTVPYLACVVHMHHLKWERGPQDPV